MLAIRKKSAGPQTSARVADRGSGVSCHRRRVSMVTATIGFCHNKNGQASIKSLDGDSWLKALGNCLAANLPNMV
jgi:hypothetical protein